MVNKFNSKLVILLIISLFFTLNISPAISSSQQNSDYATEIEMKLKIVFVGISNSFVDTNVLDDVLNSYVQGVPISIENILIDITDIGSLSLIKWKFEYIFASDLYYQDLKNLMIQNSNYGTEDNKTGFFIDTPKIKQWIADPINYPAGYSKPSSGYTLFFLNFSEIGPHWFRANYDELDTESVLVRNFLNSFGGNTDSRMFSIDLSVNNSYLEDLGSDGPIYNLTAKYNPMTNYGKIKIGYYFRDWIAEVIADLFASNLVYSTPNFRQSFSSVDISGINYVKPNSKQTIEIYLVNNITGKNVDDIIPFISTEAIESSFKDILPWYNWDVQLKAVEAQDYPQLRETIKDSTDLSLNKTLDGIPQGGVDLFTLYEWIFNEILLDNYKISMPFINTSPNTFITFAFAFDVGVLGVGYKSEFTPNILGVSLYGIIPELEFLTVTGRILPLTLTAQSYERLFVGDENNRTYGFTQLIIHENGHSIGLSHPHGVSWAASMVTDPMSYISYTYEFSQFSKDQVRRGEINHAIFYSKVYIDKINDVDYKNTVITSFNDKMVEIYEFMNKMNYIDAYEIAWNAFIQAKNAYEDQPRTSTENSQAAHGFAWEMSIFSMISLGILIKKTTNKKKF